MATNTQKAEPKTAEILDRVKTVFATKGFDGASMKDLAAAAGMSAGNFYRYFPSKDAIIEAIVGRELDLIEAEFARIMMSPDPRQALLTALRWRMQTVDKADGPLWSEIEASASRRSEIGALHARMETEIARYLVGVFARIAGMPTADAASQFGAHAAFLMMLVHGAATRSCGLSQIASPAATEALNVLVLRTIDTLLADVAASRPALSIPVLHSKV